MGFRIVTGRGTLVLPGVQAVRKMSLDLNETELSVDCVTHQGIPLKVRGVVIFKVGDDFVSIANAGRRFLDQQKMMSERVHNVFAGHLRSIVGGLTVEDMIRDREKLTGQTRAACGTEMEKLGSDRRLAADPRDRGPDRLHQEPRHAARRRRTAGRADRAGRGQPAGHRGRAAGRRPDVGGDPGQRDPPGRLPGRARQGGRQGPAGRTARRRRGPAGGRGPGDPGRRAGGAAPRAAAPGRTSASPRTPRRTRRARWPRPSATPGSRPRRPRRRRRSSRPPPRRTG